MFLSSDDNHNQRAIKARRIAYLLSRFIKGSITSTEHNELDEWVGASEKNMRLFEELTKEKNIRKGLAWMKENIPAYLKAADAELTYKISHNNRKAEIFRTTVATLIIAGFTIFLTREFQSQASQIGPLHPILLNTINPKYEDKGVLTLSNGRVIILNQVGDGELATQGSSTIAKQNGLISYSDASLNETREIQYNTISTPRGGNCTLSLSDGIKVWLNAASSIRYPVIFTGNDNKIFITGEVYFEIPKGASLLDIIVKGKYGVKVGEIATSVNINSYEDNGETVVTVLKGVAGILTRKESKVLSGRQQAVIKSSSHLELDAAYGARYDYVQYNGEDLSSIVGINSVISWKKGYLRFINQDLASILKTIGRQYDVDVSYEGKAGSLFNCLFKKDGDLRSILRSLQSAGNIVFKLEGKKLTVTYLNAS